MNENKRILLLALGIMAIVASDPPVASYFERPQSACRIVADLAVGAFDSLVRSTLPLPSSEPEVEMTDEVLVAAADGEAKETPKPEVERAPVRSADASVTNVSRVSVPKTLNAVPVTVRAGCSGTDGEPIEMLRVEAFMEVSAPAIEHG